MQITLAQAKTIGAKLYVREVNQKHLERWCLDNISKEQAHRILNVICKLKYDLAMNNPEEFTKIQTWGRDEVKKLGYQEPQVSKSI